MNYTVMNEYFIDKTSKEYKGGFNVIHNTARVYTPKDTAVVTPNSDTPYSFACPDLRAEPMVITVPEIEKSRYYSVQLVDLYTFNYDYIGSRATGNGAGSYLIAGPRWKGETPAGIKSVPSAWVRMRLHPRDLPHPALQCRRSSTTTSRRCRPATSCRRCRRTWRSRARQPPRPRSKSWPRWMKRATGDPFKYLSFILDFCPPIGPAEVEVPLRARFARIGIEAGKPYPSAMLNADEKMELTAGMKEGFGRIRKEPSDPSDRRSATGESRLPASAINTMKRNWAARAAAALAGIYGQQQRLVEALYRLLVKDSDGMRPNCAKGQRLHAGLRRRTVAARQRVLVGDDVRRQDAASGRQSAQPLPHQRADAAEPQEERRPAP